MKYEFRRPVVEGTTVEADVTLLCFVSAVICPKHRTHVLAGGFVAISCNQSAPLGTCTLLLQTKKHQKIRET